ncbi:aminotransferase class IV [Corynebacterium callunae]|uniref:aminotransferase class IV n=1 Tax=Corynebacterium callunae TaxID=1721 RepID=UPI003981F0BB
MSFLRWDGVALEPGAAEKALVVDSYLLRDGRVVRWDLHEQRFARSIPVDAYLFLDTVRAALPQTGEWFPRVEWYGGESFGVHIRPAPALRTSTSLWLSDLDDPRTQPLIKGPDLDILGRLRVMAQDRDCDDTLLISADGTVLEAANGAVVFWQDENTVILPASPVLPSITVRATIPLWEKAGIKVQRANIRHLDLPAWCGSALHGWTAVEYWGRGDGKITAAPAPLVKPWNQALWGASKSA